MQKEQRPGSGDPQSAAVWLDTRGEWQVHGVVRHDEGNIRVMGDSLRILRSGRTGLLRRTPWEEEQTIAIAALKSLRIFAGGRRRNVLDLTVRAEALSQSGGELTLKNCRPLSMLRALVEDLRARNPQISVDWQNPPGDQ